MSQLNMYRGLYIGETDRRINERIIDHNKRDKNVN